MNYSALGVDQSMTSTGFAHIAKGDKSPTWGKFILPDWTDNEGEQAWRFLEWLGDLVTQKQVTHLFLEQTFVPQDHHETLTEKMAQYGQILMADMVRFLVNRRGGLQVDFTLVSPQQWRPMFIGTDKPPEGYVKHQRRKWLKDKAVAACAERGWLLDDHDIADALGVLNFGVCTIDRAYATRQGPLFRRAEMAFDNEQRSLK